MLCQSCNINQASTMIKTVSGGRLKEEFLCSSCAKAKGYETMFGSIGELLGSIFINQSESVEPQRCELCGSSFEEISRTGKMGCANCYQIFENQLLPSIQRVHGSAVHQGKRPGSYALRLKDPYTLAVAADQSKKPDNTDTKAVQNKQPETRQEADIGTSSAVKNDGARIQLQSQLEEASRQLKAAVDIQDFENAVQLRDKIKALKAELENGSEQADINSQQSYTENQSGRATEHGKENSDFSGVMQDHDPGKELKQDD